MTPGMWSWFAALFTSKPRWKEAGQSAGRPLAMELLEDRTAPSVSVLLPVSGTLPAPTSSPPSMTSSSSQAPEGAVHFDLTDFGTAVLVSNEWRYGDIPLRPLGTIITLTGPGISHPLVLPLSSSSGETGSLDHLPNSSALFGGPSPAQDNLGPITLLRFNDPAPPGKAAVSPVGAGPVSLLRFNDPAPPGKAEASPIGAGLVSLLRSSDTSAGQPFAGWTLGMSGLQSGPDMTRVVLQQRLSPSRGAATDAGTSRTDSLPVLSSLEWSQALACQLGEHVPVVGNLVAPGDGRTEAAHAQDPNPERPLSTEAPGATQSSAPGLQGERRGTHFLTTVLVLSHAWLFYRGERLGTDRDQPKKGLRLPR
jgi:hypothetical protein